LLITVAIVLLTKYEMPVDGSKAYYMAKAYEMKLKGARPRAKLRNAIC
jgi:hypothetical protein